MSFQQKYRRFGNVVKCSTKPMIPVIDNLAITPSRMAQLVDEGIPVSTSLLSGAYTDGVVNPSWDLPIDERRGVDIAQVWNAQRTARKNITHNTVVKNGS